MPVPFLSFFRPTTVIATHCYQTLGTVCPYMLLHLSQDFIISFARPAFNYPEYVSRLLLQAYFAKSPIVFFCILTLVSPKLTT